MRQGQTLPQDPRVGLAHLDEVRGVESMPPKRSEEELTAIIKLTHLKRGFLKNLKVLFQFITSNLKRLQQMSDSLKMPHSINVPPVLKHNLNRGLQ